jgi:hypothetical protein
MKLPTDSDMVDLAAAAYNPTSVPWLDQIENAVRVFRSDRDAVSDLAIQGTHNDVGWALDFAAWPIEQHAGIDHPQLGFLHAGFYAAARSVYPQILALAKDRRVTVQGHSLGAALTLLIGAELIVDGVPPLKIGAFAPPRVGGDQFVKVATSAPYCAYRYANDPVPLVPFTIPPAFLYRRVPFVQLGASTFDIEFSDHHIDNYVREVKAFESKQAMAGAA